MRIFDAHCDTILKIVEDGADIAAEPGADAAPHVTLAGLRDAGVGAQVFAVFAIEARFPGSTRQTALELIEAIDGLCTAHPEYLEWEAGRPGAAGEPASGDPRAVDGPDAVSGRLEPAVADPQRGADSTPTRVIVSLEGADPLEGDPQNLHEFHSRGVRLVTLAWDDNRFCGAVFGHREPGADGLTAKGEELVGVCEELGVRVDVSHATDAGFWDVCRMATRPFVASHSDCRAVCSAPRNLTDEMIRALAERGGVMGINLCPSFLSQSFYDAEEAVTAPFMAAWHAGDLTLDEAGEKAGAVTRSLPRPPLETVVAHVRHAIDVGGEDCVGLGGDLDGVDALPAGVDGVQDYPRIVAALLAAGLTEAQVEKVCWGNFARVFAG
ncbi:MAG: membrane dipeptidase [Actinobacteria bacterium]|nr:membrane dipeptidase [Actinomycetota bacterium]